MATVNHELLPTQKRVAIVVENEGAVGKATMEWDTAPRDSRWADSLKAEGAPDDLIAEFDAPQVKITTPDGTVWTRIEALEHCLNWLKAKAEAD